MVFISEISILRDTLSKNGRSERRNGEEWKIRVIVSVLYVSCGDWQHGAGIIVLKSNIVKTGNRPRPHGTRHPDHLTKVPPPHRM